MINFESVSIFEPAAISDNPPSLTFHRLYSEDLDRKKIIHEIKSAAWFMFSVAYSVGVVAAAIFLFVPTAEGLFAISLVTVSLFGVIDGCQRNWTSHLNAADFVDKVKDQLKAMEHLTIPQFANYATRITNIPQLPITPEIDQFRPLIARYTVLKSTLQDAITKTETFKQALDATPREKKYDEAQAFFNRKINLHDALAQLDWMHSVIATPTNLIEFEEFSEKRRASQVHITAHHELYQKIESIEVRFN